MQFAGIFHKTSEQMSYALNENELIVNLRTGYDVRRVFIHYGDPFESGILGGNEKWTGKREEIFLGIDHPMRIQVTPWGSFSSSTLT